METKRDWSGRMLFILNDHLDADDDDQGMRSSLAGWVRFWEPIENLDRSCFNAWRALNQVEIPAADLCISFREQADLVEAGDVPRIWSLPPSS